MAERAMKLYVQYHNIAVEGLPFDDPPFSATRLWIHTRKTGVQSAVGWVFLIAGLGRPRQYYLWETFEIDSVRVQPNGEFVARGDGWRLAPPRRLAGPAFERFRRACANFVGFCRVDHLPYAQTLLAIARSNRLPAKVAATVNFLKAMLVELKGDDPDREAVVDALKRLEPPRALSIRQPHAEAILRSVKTIEYRNSSTRVRGRVLIYASKGRYPVGRETALMRQYGIRDVTCDDLPRGVLVATVDLHVCRGGSWHVRDLRRASKLVAPTRQPQPVWFVPF
jgi:ASCH domain